MAPSWGSLLSPSSSRRPARTPSNITSLSKVPYHPSRLDQIDPSQLKFGRSRSLLGQYSHLTHKQKKRWPWSLQIDTRKSHELLIIQRYPKLVLVSPPEEIRSNEWNSQHGFRKNSIFLWNQSPSLPRLRMGEKTWPVALSRLDVLDHQKSWRYRHQRSHSWRIDGLYHWFLEPACQICS